MDASSPELAYISHPSSPMSPPYKKQKMTVTQTYRLAHTARGKLSTEASRGEYDLRILVGHANLLDHLMIDLSTVEQEQERAYQTGTPRSTTISFADEAVELPEVSDSEDEEDEQEVEEDEDDEDDDVSDYDDEEEVSVATATPLKRTPSRSPVVILAEDLVDDDDYDEDYNNPELSLVRTQSRSDVRSPEHGVPELVHDSDDSDDESLSPPLSPDQTAVTYTNITIKDFARKTHTPVAAAAEEALHDQGFWIPQQQSAMIAAC
jgi:hypothetical protein